MVYGEDKFDEEFVVLCKFRERHRKEEQQPGQRRNRR